jgi:ArsR family transcriptional regulator
MNKDVSLFKALADETRLRILALLTTGELCVCELMGVLELPQSTVSRHLAYLRNAGWVQGRREGVWMYYRLAEFSEPLQAKLAELLHDELPRRKEINHDLERLRAVQKSLTEKDCG